MKPFDPRLLRHAAGIGNLLFGSVVLGVLTALATIAQAILVAGMLADVILRGFGLAAVSHRLLVLALVVAVRAALAWAAEELARRSATGVTDRLRKDLLIHAARLGPRWRSGEHGGELAALVTTGIDSLTDYLSRYLPQLVLAVLVPLSMLIYLSVTDVTSAIIVVATLPLIPIFMALIGWYTEKQTRSKWRALSRLAGHFTDVVAGLPTLKVFGRAKAQAATVRRITDDYRKATMSTLRVAFLSSMVLELLASLSVALVAVTIGFRLVDGHLGLSVGLTVLMLAPEAYLPLRSLGTQFHAAADGVAASKTLMTMLDVPLPTAGDRRDVALVPAVMVNQVIVGDINGSDRGAVGPLDLVFPAGKITVVTGHSGSGKTTLLHLLAAVLRPSAGSVQVSGLDGEMVDLTEVAPDLWSHRLAWAGQRPVLRAGTIRENLEAPDADENDLRAALTAMAAATFVDELPRGWDTELGQDGAGLSQGQRQRICLARALLRDSSMVLLDEPTAALDDATERQVLAGLSSALAGRTVVLVTHRAGPLEIADQIVTLPAGPEVAEESRPDEVQQVAEVGAGLAVTPW